MSTKNTQNREDRQGSRGSLAPGDETMQILLDWKRKPDREKNTGLDLIDMDEEPAEETDTGTAGTIGLENMGHASAGKEGLREPEDAIGQEEDLEYEDITEEEDIEDQEEDGSEEGAADLRDEDEGEDRFEDEYDSEEAFEDDNKGEDAFEDDDEREDAFENEDDAEDAFEDEDEERGKKGSGTPHSKKAVPTKSRLRFNLHLILLAAIFLIAATAVYRLYRWNQGTPIEDLDTEDVDPSQFDVETLDMILPMDASLLEGREDDGVTTVLCLGNNPFSDDRSDTGLASLIAQKTDSVVYDCSFPDSSVACKNATYSPDYPRDHFNLYYVIQWLRNNDFSAVTTIASQEYNPHFLEAAEVLRTVDMDKVDVIVIMYDSTDYNIGTPSDNPNNPYDVTAYTGGLRTTIEAIKETWPYIRIFVMSHTYAQYLDDDGNLLNGTITDLGNGTLNHYLVKESEAAMDCGVSFIDNYYGTINEDNYAQYLTDHMHYNDAGREKLADRIAYVINNRMGVVSSTTSGDK